MRYPFQNILNNRSFVKKYPQFQNTFQVCSTDSAQLFTLIFRLIPATPNLPEMNILPKFLNFWNKPGCNREDQVWSDQTEQCR